MKICININNSEIHNDRKDILIEISRERRMTRYEQFEITDIAYEEAGKQVINAIINRILDKEKK